MGLLACICTGRLQPEPVFTALWFHTFTFPGAFRHHPFKDQTMLRHLLFLLLLLTGSISVSGQSYNRPIPPGLAPYEFRQWGTSQLEVHYLMTPNFHSIRNMTIVGKDGFVEWYAGNGSAAITNFEYHPTHHLFSFASTDNPSSTMTFYLMDEDFMIVDSVIPAYGHPTDIHEFRILSNGNYLLSATNTSVVDLTGYTVNGSPGQNNTTVRNFVIQEFAGDSLVFNWNSIDHIHPSQFVSGYPFNTNDFDYAHGNAVAEDTDGNLLVSMRHINAIYKIHRHSGQVLWVLGGAQSDLSFTNDAGFSGQHDVRVLANGHITVFDNGNAPGQPRASRAVEYELDTTAMTATRVWSYADDLGTHVRAMGSFRTAPNGERIIGMGYCYRPAANLIHLDDQGQLVAELLLKDSVASYRAVIHEFPFILDRPEITCSVQGNEVVLSAPAGYSSYRWSTGEQTQQITVSTADTFQVWVNKGIGMIGSEPFFLTGLSDPCGNGMSSVNRPWDSGTPPISFLAKGGMIRSNTDGSITVLNAIGQVVISETVHDTSLTDISAWPAGIYIVRFERTASEVWVQKFQKW